MKQKEFLSTSELAKILGISRVAVFKKIKKGEIKAIKVGRNFVIDKKDLIPASKFQLSGNKRKELDRAYRKVIKEYGEALKNLGND